MSSISKQASDPPTSLSTERGQLRPEHAVVLGRAGDEVLQLVVALQPKMRCHRLEALALP